jgi:hypothetical protein
MADITGHGRLSTGYRTAPTAIRRLSEGDDRVENNFTTVQ